MPTPSLDELIQTVSDRCAGEGALDRLAVAVEVSNELMELADALVGHFFEEARAAGASWSEVGAALGVSKQGAHQWAQRRMNAFIHEHGLGRRVTTRRKEAVTLRGVGAARGQGLLSRFTDPARAAIAAAADEAQQLGHAYLGTEHVLLALLADRRTAAAVILKRAGVDVVRLKATLVTLAGPSSVPAPAGDRSGDTKSPRQTPFTPRAKRALELALREALRLSDHYVGTEHLLLGLAAEGDGIAGRAIADAGVTLDGLRSAVEERFSA